MKTVLLMLSFVVALASSGVVGQELSLEEVLAQEFSFEEVLAQAEQGIARAQHNLGLVYSNGIGVPRNDAEAVKWYRLAAEQGHAVSQHNIGLMYIFSDGVPQNAVLAYMWESLAAAQGHEDARRNRDIYAKALPPEQLARAQEIATRCFESDYQDCE